MSSMIYIITALFIHATLSANTNVDCDEAFECAGQSVNAYHVWAQGYKSIAGSTSSIVSSGTCQCYGSFACTETSFINAKYGPWCAGSNSCSHVPNIIGGDDVYGNAASSLSHSAIFNSTNVKCRGDTSCSHTTINDAQHIYGYGSFSLYYATIICTTGNICNIHCIDIMCDTINFNCSNNCNIYQYPISIYSSISNDISTFNFTTATQINDALCSKQPNNMVFDNRYKSQNPTNYGSEGSLCCRGSYSCDGATIGFNSPTNERIICSGAYSCEFANINTVGSLFCEGIRSCYRSPIIMAPIVYCLGAFSCQFSNLLSISQIYCSAGFSCWDTNINSSGSDTTLYLLGYGAGYRMNFICDKLDICSVYCIGQRSCYGITVNCTGNCIVECDENSLCPGGFGWTVGQTRAPTMTITTNNPTESPTINPASFSVVTKVITISDLKSQKSSNDNHLLTKKDYMYIGIISAIGLCCLLLFILYGLKLKSNNHSINVQKKEDVLNENESEIVKIPQTMKKLSNNFGEEYISVDNDDDIHQIAQQTPTDV